MAARRGFTARGRELSASSHLEWLARPAVLAATARAEWLALASEADAGQGALDRAKNRDRDAAVKLRKVVDITVSSLLLTGYDRAGIGEAIRGFMLTALASESVPESVVDAILANVAMWVERRL
jgi:hypothetical protein